MIEELRGINFKDYQVITASLINIIAVISVGFWTNRIIKRKTQLEQIPIDHLSELVKNLNRLVSDCLSEEENNKITSNLTKLSNEVFWLIEIFDNTHTNNYSGNYSGLGSDLFEFYFRLKNSLTDYDYRNTMQISMASHKLRMAALKIQWVVSQKIISRKKDEDIFIFSQR